MVDDIGNLHVICFRILNGLKIGRHHALVRASKIKVSKNARGYISYIQNRSFVRSLLARLNFRLQIP